jgi:hypothetical protein
MNQGGFAMQIPAPELYYQLLPAHHVAIHGKRGVKVRGLWYDGLALGPYRDERSARGGRHKGKWVIRRDPRDARAVFFQEPRRTRGTRCAGRGCRPRMRFPRSATPAPGICSPRPARLG